MLIFLLFNCPSISAIVFIDAAGIWKVKSLRLLYQLHLLQWMPWTCWSRFLGFPIFLGFLFPSFFVLSSFFPSYHFPFLFELSSSPSLMPWFLVSLSQPFSHFWVFIFIFYFFLWLIILLWGLIAPRSLSFLFVCIIFFLLWVELNQRLVTLLGGIVLTSPFFFLFIP